MSNTLKPNLKRKVCFRRNCYRFRQILFDEISYSFLSCVIVCFIRVFLSDVLLLSFLPITTSSVFERKLFKNILKYSSKYKKYFEYRIPLFNNYYSFKLFKHTTTNNALSTVKFKRTFISYDIIILE